MASCALWPLLLALLIFTPVIFWNAQHEWASFVFQTSRRLTEAPRFSLHKLLASALILITPTGAIAVIYALLSRPAGDPASAPVRAYRLLSLAIVFPLAIFAVFSLRHEVKLDWTGAPWVAALPLLGQAMVARPPSLSRGALRLRNAWAPTLTIMLIVYGTGLCYLATGLPACAVQRTHGTTAGRLEEPEPPSGVIGSRLCKEKRHDTCHRGHGSLRHRQ